MMITLRRSWLGAVAILSLAAGQAFGQQEQEQQRQQDSQQQGQAGEQDEPLGRLLDQRGAQDQQARTPGGQTGQLDKHLAKLVIAKNEAAIKLNELAQKQAQEQKVKDYASQMVEAHQQLNQKLQQVAGESQGIQGQRSPGQPGLQQQRPQQQELQQPDQSQQDSQRPFGRSQGGQAGSQQGNPAEQMVQMYERIESQYTQKLMEGLRDKQGKQFDNTFMGLEVLGHMRMVECLDVMQQHASGQLQQTLQQAHQETQKHLQQAQQLSQQLEETAVASREQPTQQR